MKKGKGVNELLDLIFSEDLSVSRLKKLGFSEEDAIEFLSMLHQDNSKYMRVLNKDERESFTPDAMIYLLSMLQSG